MQFDTTRASKVKITSEKEVTIADVVAEANAIWKKARARGNTFGDTEAADALMRDIREEHPQFCKSYPTVSRYICQMQEYSSKALKLWLMKIEARPWKTEDEYIDAQADYVCMLFKAKKPRSTATEVSTLRANMRSMLRNEHEAFKKCATSAEQDVLAQEAELRERNKRELREALAAIGPDGFLDAGTTRVECDLLGKHHAAPIHVAQATLPVHMSADSLLG
jgi:hypothetical protein